MGCLTTSGVTSLGLDIDIEWEINNVNFGPCGVGTSAMLVCI